MKLIWHESYDFGIPEIDDGHHQIIFKMNEICELIDAGNHEAALSKAAHMIAIERKHMAAENALLKLHGYTGIREHTRFHKQIHRQMTNLMEALADDDKEIINEQFSHLRENIIDDILKGDLPFKSLLQHKILGP